MLRHIVERNKLMFLFTTLTESTLRDDIPDMGGDRLEC